MSLSYVFDMCVIELQVPCRLRVASCMMYPMIAVCTLPAAALPVQQGQTPRQAQRCVKHDHNIVA